MTGSGHRFYGKALFHPVLLCRPLYRRKSGEARLWSFPDPVSPLSSIFRCHVQNGGQILPCAGHFHGGTIRLPGLGGVMTPQYQFFLPWCAGIFEEQGHYMAVSRGLGTHSINIRLNNRPQLLGPAICPANRRKLSNSPS